MKAISHIPYTDRTLDEIQREIDAIEESTDLSGMGDAQTRYDALVWFRNHPARDWNKQAVTNA